MTVTATSIVDTSKSDTATVKVRKLTSIAIKTAPSKTSYIAGESFDKKDMVVVASYSEGSDLLEQMITNYTISPDGALTVSNTSVTVSFSDCGVTKTAAQVITVSNSTPSNSTITPTTAAFDKYMGAINYGDISVTQTPNGNTLTDIKNSSAALIRNIDYTVSGDTIAIKKEYLAQQSTGTTTLTFDYSAGTDPVLAITVSDSTPSSIHKPVTGITGVPTTASTSVDLTLTGTVAPADASNKTIVWSVKSAGTTGAVITGNTLKTTRAGTVVVTATVTNGLTASSN